VKRFRHGFVAFLANRGLGVEGGRHIQVCRHASEGRMEEPSDDDDG